MKMLSSGSYTIAWFKLAEFVSRGEKERALTMYKLLMHSVTNRAFAVQLEADILSAFQDHTSAIDKYLISAQLYQDQYEFEQAIAIYEHIVIMTKNIETLRLLIDLYLISPHRRALTIFMGKIKALDEKFYVTACDIISKSNAI